jgi:hypothetical protein
MKNIYWIFLALVIFSATACGPGEEEKAKMKAEEKSTMDSLFDAANKNMDAMDSTAVKADSTAK